MKRLFVGIGLDDEARSRVVVVQDRVKEVATRQGVRFVRPEKLHLTLLFLGEAEPEPAMALCAAVSARHSSFGLRTTELGGFPDLRRPKVVWLGLDGDVEPLAALQGDVAQTFAKSEEPYIPHLTLARISPGSKAVGYAVQNLPISDLEPTRLTIGEITLFESTSDGRYEVLGRWPLA